MTTLTALLTSHNRKAHTLDCLACLQRAANRADVELDAVLVDDASRDGTAAAVAAGFPWVTVEPGDGSLFWNRGMHQAQAIAMRREVDFLLWVNDDTLLFEDALVRLLDTHETLRARHHQPAVVVGATCDRISGALTYSGAVAVNRWRRFTYRKVWSETEAVECETMNGNLVLLPMQIARTVGNIDPVYEHAMGDTDYALRVRAAGFHVFVAPGFAGHCSNNTRVGTFLDDSLPFPVRWRKMLSRKGLPPRSWWHLTRKHGGVLWPIYFAWPYLRLMASSLPGVGKRITWKPKP